MATGAAAAALTLIDRASTSPLGATGPMPVGQVARSGNDGLRDLMAQMSHELRTPLNAVIGFSEVMLRELHGPLGHARYQEYAHHISESGGRLLKSSEDALAVTEAMSALIADRMHGSRERLMAGSLVREAWKATGVAEASELRADDDVLQHVRDRLRAARHACRRWSICCARPPATHRPAPTVEVKGRRRGGARSLEIRVAGQRAGVETAGPGSLRVILARLLLETQGATLTSAVDETGCWSATVEFGARALTLTRHPGQRSRCKRDGAEPGPAASSDRCHGSRIVSAAPRLPG